MQTLFKTLLFITLVFTYSACNQNSSQTEKDYIKNLEEKNRELETELQNEKNRPPIIVEKPVEKIFTPKEVPIENSIAKDYFTLGSTESEVIEVMGDPTEINDFEYADTKWLHYGMSYVVLRNNKVKEYHNSGNNLKVKIKMK